MSVAVTAPGGCVVWFTGLPASGKSTLAVRVRGALVARHTVCAMLDGDEVRAALVPPLAYDDAGRAAFYATLARLAALLARQGLVALVPATAHRRTYRDAARALAPRFIEVYVATPLELCLLRDPKGLYAAAAAGRTQTLPGAGPDYEPPAAPDVTASGGEDDHAVATIVQLVHQA